MISLTQSQRDALVAVKMGGITHDSTYDCYWFFPPYDGCPRINSATLTCRALFKKNLITRSEAHQSKKCELTVYGQDVFEQVATAEEKVTLAKQLEYEERYKANAAFERRQHAFDDLHRDATRERRERGNLLQYAKQSIDTILLNAALKIGNGANDVDAIIAEIKSATVEKNRIEAELNEIQRNNDEFWEQRKLV